MKTIDKKYQEQQQSTQSLWQEFLKSRDREQNLERLFLMAFSCFAQNGFNIFGGTSGGNPNPGSANVSRELI